MKWKKVFITGCGGMLGEAMYSKFSSIYGSVLATDKVVSEDWLVALDVRDTRQLKETFYKYKPDIVIHLAAETDLEFCETHPDIAQNTNSYATRNIAKLCQENVSTLIYISTAGVFDGQKDGFYTEDDKPNPIMVYGRTKYEGELYAMKYCTKSFVVRAGWMMGGGPRKEKKFIYKILQQVAKGRKEIFAVNDKWGTPTYTYDFTSNILRLLETRRYGLYHMACEGRCNRYEVAQEILRICKRPDIELTPVNSEFFKEVYFAPRPPSEMMYNSNLRKLGLNYMRVWKECLQYYIEKHFPDYIGQGKKRSVAMGKKPTIRIEEARLQTRKNRNIGSTNKFNFFRRKGQRK